MRSGTRRKGLPARPTSRCLDRVGNHSREGSMAWITRAGSQKLSRVVVLGSCEDLLKPACHLAQIPDLALCETHNPVVGRATEKF